MKKVVIVGGGITGLTAAYRLNCLKKQNNLPLEIVLLEASNQLGGVINSQLMDDYVVEHGPDAFLADRPEMRDLLNELGLADCLLPTQNNNRRAFVARHKKLIPIPTGFYLISPTNLKALLKSQLFSILGKIRIALEAFIGPRIDITDESVASFISRRFGKELLARAGEPLIGGIYMADVNLLSAQSTLPHFTAIEQEFGSIIKGLKTSDNHNTSTASGARYNLFSSFAQGTSALIKRLIEETSDIKICLNTKLACLLERPSGWLLETEDGQNFKADSVIFAIPAKLIAPIISKLDKKLEKKLSQIETIPSVVVNLLYRRQDIGHELDGFGFVVPKTENKQFIACGWISRKFAHRSPNDHEIIRVFVGGSMAAQLCSLSDKQLFELAHNQITPYLDLKARPQKAWLARWPHGLPFYKIGHAQLVQNIESQIANHPGIYLAGASYNGLGIPDCIRSAETIVSKLITSMQLDQSIASAQKIPAR